eukprot:126517_1
MDQQMNDMSGNQQEINAIPRINGQMLMSGKFSGNEVTIVGKFLGSNDNDSKKKFEASDGQKFSVGIDVSQPFTGYNTKFIEIRGIVQNDGTILQQAYQEWGDDFAMGTWDKFIRLTHQYPTIF